MSIPKQVKKEEDEESISTVSIPPTELSEDTLRAFDRQWFDNISFTDLAAKIRIEKLTNDADKDQEEYFIRIHLPPSSKTQREMYADWDKKTDARNAAYERRYNNLHKQHMKLLDKIKANKKKTKTSKKKPTKKNTNNKKRN